MKSIDIPGLDGSSLLGFLAALGVVEVLSSTRSAGIGQGAPRLSWTHSGGWHPRLAGVDSVDELVVRILEDARSKEVERVLQFRYVKVEKNGPKSVRALKTPVAVLRAALKSSLSLGQFGAAGFLASLACETAFEPADEAKAATPEDLNAKGVSFDPDVPLGQVALPTPFDFTSRNTQFLDQIGIVRGHLTDVAVIEDLIEGRGTPSSRIMRWDALTDMPGALFDRSGPLSRPVAEWLAFRGIAFFVLSGSGTGLEMPGLSGRRKAGRFSWPLWEGFLTKDVIRSILAVQWPMQKRAAALAQGVIAGYSVELRKDATGYDGAVSAGISLTFAD